MFFEYALDPNVVAEAHEISKAHFLLSNFGINAGRIVSRFPHRWKRLVYEAFDANSNMRSQDIRRKRVVELVEQLTSTFAIRPGSEWVETDGWVANAIREHSRKPFQMILVPEEYTDHSNIFGIEEIQDNAPESWVAPSTKEVSRTAEELASAIAPLLNMAKKIWFVDPYFRANLPRYRGPLEEFLKLIRYEQGPEIQIHVKKKDESNTATEKWSDIEDNCRVHLPKIIPLGQTVTVRCWTERDGGDTLHNRYVLTNVGSVMFGHGLDEGHPNAASTDTLTRLSSESQTTRFQQYDCPNSAFDLDSDSNSAFVPEGEVVITGRAHV